MLGKVHLAKSRSAPSHFGCGPPKTERAVRASISASYYASATLCDGWKLLESCPIAELLARPRAGRHLK